VGQVSFWRGELTGDHSFCCRKSVFLSLGLALLTVSLFVYILLLPLVKGEHPNVRHPHPRRGSLSIDVLGRILDVVPLLEGVRATV